MTYELEKKIWTDADFDKMGWHDNHIYKINLTADLVMDIDYIFKWNQPDLEGLPFTFWIAPATLVFRNIRQLSFDFSVGFGDSFEIEDIERESDDQWAIITRQGDFRFASEGYEQFIRQEPSFQFAQTISYIERNGYSLEKITNQENPNKSREDVLERRKLNFEHFENAKKRHLIRVELDQLVKSRDKNEIDLKEYLLKRKEIKDLLFSYDFFLKGTPFETW